MRSVRTLALSLADFLLAWLYRSRTELQEGSNHVCCRARGWDATGTLLHLSSSSLGASACTRRRDDRDGWEPRRAYQQGRGKVHMAQIGVSRQRFSRSKRKL